ncbi:MAG: protelomerase family protein [Cyanobacteria bacterium P01_A01_bin.37]
MRSWLQKHYKHYVKQVEHLTPGDRTEAEQWAQWMRAQWDEYGMTKLTQQKDLMREVRASLKVDLKSDDHIALQTMTFTREEWIEANRRNIQRTASQNEQQVILSPKTVNTIVSRATQLLASREWYDIAAGLAVLTGRRSTEVLKTAEFSSCSEFSVLFSGALKRKGELTSVTFEIPTLCRAEYVLNGLAKLRTIITTTALSESEVNNRLSNSVAQACDRHFADIVPAPLGRDNLYTHLFRKIYATIATYFYCPPTVDEAEYRAHIQGHFSGHEHLSLAERRTIASDRHYRTYIILDDLNRTAKGIRLNWQGVRVVEDFRLGTEDLDLIAPTTEPKREIVAIHKKRPEPTKPLDIEVVEAVQAIIEYNNSCRNHADKWVISYPVMKDLLASIGKATQSKIKAVFDANSELIDQHHREHGLSSKHNRCHTGESVTEVIDF